MKIRIGYRRLFRGIGCDLGKHEMVKIEAPVGDGAIQLFLFHQPVLEWYERSGEDHFIVGQKVQLRGNISPEDVGFAAPDAVYSDIFSWKDIDISDELSAALEADPSSGMNEALTLASEDQGLVLYCDLACGTIGLRLHNQFVTDLVFEAFYVMGKDGSPHSSFSFIAPEAVNPVRLKEETPQVLNTDLRTAGSPEPMSIRRKALAFNWLLRGWAEKDRISRFVAFFTAVEIILGGYQGEQQVVDGQMLDEIRLLIATHGGERSDSMLALINRLRLPSPSLASRFEVMARTSGIDGWENDLQAFGQYNRLRNNLVHRGDQSISLDISISNTVVVGVEQIAIRYVNWSIFQDSAVHDSVSLASRWPRRESAIPIHLTLVRCNDRLDFALHGKKNWSETRLARHCDTNCLCTPWRRTFLLRREKSEEWVQKNCLSSINADKGLMIIDLSIILSLYRVRARYRLRKILGLYVLSALLLLASPSGGLRR